MSITRLKIVGIGEVLWDLFPSGRQLGGAPANFIYHAHSLGAEAYLISRIGRDSLGEEILKRFGELKVPTAAVQIDERAPTGMVTVALSGNGIPAFTINSPAAWDGLECPPEALRLVGEADAVCFGTLAQRNARARASIYELVAVAKPGR